MKDIRIFIQELYLGCNEIRLQAGLELARTVKNMSSLKIFDLNGSSIKIIFLNENFIEFHFRQLFRFRWYRWDTRNSWKSNIFQSDEIQVEFNEFLWAEIFIGSAVFSDDEGTDDENESSSNESDECQITERATETTQNITNLMSKVDFQVNFLIQKKSLFISKTEILLFSIRKQLVINGNLWQLSIPSKNISRSLTTMIKNPSNDWLN